MQLEVTEGSLKRSSGVEHSSEDAANTANGLETIFVTYLPFQRVLTIVSIDWSI